MAKKKQSSFTKALLANETKRAQKAQKLEDDLLAPLDSKAFKKAKRHKYFEFVQDNSRALSKYLFKVFILMAIFYMVYTIPTQYINLAISNPNLKMTSRVLWGMTQISNLYNILTGATLVVIGVFLSKIRVNRPHKSIKKDLQKYIDDKRSDAK